MAALVLSTRVSMELFKSVQEASTALGVTQSQFLQLALAEKIRGQDGQLSIIKDAVEKTVNGMGVAWEFQEAVKALGYSGFDAWVRGLVRATFKMAREDGKLSLRSRVSIKLKGV